jgi:hypothetical protein
MYMLLLIILNSSGHSVTSQTIQFPDQPSCLKAMSETIDMEKNVGTIRARCLKL